MHASKVLVTIALAVYNVEDFLEYSLDCIVNQSLKEIEILCINDGSNDKTLSILKEYAKKDNRIKIVNKFKNEGLAVARNESLKLAKGKYIIFLDGDDLYNKSLAEKALELAEREQSDIVYWDYIAFTHTKQIEKLIKKPSDLINVDKKDKKMWLKRPSFTWVKLIRTEKARELKIHFPKGLTRQDIPVHWKLVTQLNKVSILPERLAYYRQQPAATTTKKDKRLFDLVYVMDIVEEYLRSNKIFNLYKNEFYTQRFNFFHGMFDKLQNQYKKESIELITKRMDKESYIFLNSSNFVRPQAKYFLQSLEGNFFAKVKLHMWEVMRSIYRIIKN